MTGKFKSKKLFLKETDSTNRAMWKLLDSDNAVEEWLCLMAGHQTAGRGQGNTTWVDEAGKNLTCSFLLQPVFLSPAQQFLLNKCVSLALCEALSEISIGLSFEIKWPNDIYCKGRKLSGTLIENRIQGRSYEVSVVGIGINVNQVEFPADIPNPTSLALLTGRQFNPDACLDILLKHLYHYYSLLKENQASHINKKYADKLIGYNDWRTYLIEGEVVSLKIEGVDDYGKLITRNKDDQIVDYGMKELVFTF